MGVKGIKGEQGSDGQRGKQGVDGPAGPAGEKGGKGAPGYAGFPGTDGLDVKKKWIILLFLFSRGNNYYYDLLFFIQGETGESGNIGPPGKQGSAGEKGQYIPELDEIVTGPIGIQGDLGKFYVQNNRSILISLKNTNTKKMFKFI